MKSSEVRVVILSSLAGAACYNLDPSRLPCPKEEYNEFAEYAVSKVWWLHVSRTFSNLMMNEVRGKAVLVVGDGFSCFFLCRIGLVVSENIHQEPILNLPSWWCIAQKGGGLLTRALSTKVSRKHGSLRSTSGHYWYRSWRSDPNVGLGRWKSTSMRWKILEIFHAGPTRSSLGKGQGADTLIFNIKDRCSRYYCCWLKSCTS